MVSNLSKQVKQENFNESKNESDSSATEAIMQVYSHYDWDHTHSLCY